MAGIDETTTRTSHGAHSVAPRGPHPRETARRRAVPLTRRRRDDAAGRSRYASCWTAAEPVQAGVTPSVAASTVTPSRGERYMRLSRLARTIAVAAGAAAALVVARPAHA